MKRRLNPFDVVNQTFYGFVPAVVDLGGQSSVHLIERPQDLLAYYESQDDGGRWTDDAPVRKRPRLLSDDREAVVLDYLRAHGGSAFLRVNFLDAGLTFAQMKIAIELLLEKKLVTISRPIKNGPGLYSLVDAGNDHLTDTFKGDDE